MCKQQGKFSLRVIRNWNFKIGFQYSFLFTCSIKKKFSVLETAMRYLSLNIFSWDLQVSFSIISQCARLKLSYFLPEIWKKKASAKFGRWSKVSNPVMLTEGLCVWLEKNPSLLSHWQETDSWFCSSLLTSHCMGWPVHQCVSSLLVTWHVTEEEKKALWK